MYSGGYKYWLAYKKGNNSYYRCSRYKSHCPGRCVVNNELVRSITEHTHGPEPDRVMVEQFRKVLTQRAATESTDLYSIYWDEASQHAEASLLYTYTAAESAMRKARRKQFPPVPDLFQDVGEILNNSNLFRVHSGQNKDQFYQTMLDLKGSTCLIFAHLKTMEQLGKVEEIYVDTSIQMSHFSTEYHLLTVNSVQDSTNIPLIYAIMTSKSQSDFAAVFAYIRESLGDYVSPNVIMANFDINMQQALTFTFPEATIKGFWFNYTDAVLKEIKDLGMLSETARGHSSSCLRMLLVLPLLPADYIRSGLEAVKKWAEEKKIFSTQMNAVCTYIEKKWIRAVGAEKMSIFGLPNSIHNHIQTFVKDLKTAIGSANTIWELLDTLTHVATRTFVKVNRKQKQPEQPKQQKKSVQCRERIINDVTQSWIRTPVHLRNPLNFLQLTSHCMNDAIYYANLEDFRNKRKNMDDGYENVKSRCRRVQPKQDFPASGSSSSLAIPNNVPIATNSSTTVDASANPPPLVFFPKVKTVERKIDHRMNTGPPPLVPISSKR
ncbi:hypothetical protein Bhyg_04675 [Pseudolycoriella hygida]|uniref:FLYWCH-type domain-containing protein n=1 Tax=Pseudolycoriella hygida TaxID=35572 RepID=A0A9Q0NFV8_9DIPT|nr:hypothetical protein Bhyg_04675 [Pseudolycoriella hygida]